MVLLILFGFLAGAATALTPCVLPVLPVVLSAGSTGGRRRPLGIVSGLVVSFTFAVVALVYVIDALGLPNDLLRKVAIFVLLGFGLILMVPALAARVEAFGSRFAGRIPTPKGGTGFGSGFLLGLSLGIVYSPCAGPILAGVSTLTASRSFDAGRLAVALAYGLGTAVVLYALMLGGRRLVRPLSRRGGAFQIAMGAVMVVFALAMLGNLDTRFENRIAADLPGWLTTPAESLEDSGGAKNALASLQDAHGIGALVAAGGAEAEAPRGGGSGGPAPEAPEPRREAEPRPGEAGAGVDPAPETQEDAVELHEYGAAPEFTDTEQWFNTPGDKPLTMKGLRGKVVLIDFWTYSCINCIRTLPYLNAWYQRYKKDGLVIVGVHSPEFPFEREASNVKMAIEAEGIEYPVVQDNELGTWEAYGNQYWPAEYFVGADGQVRYAHFGEGEYGEKETVIRELLREAGDAPGKGRTDAHGIAPSDATTTPETYLGPYRAERFTNNELSPGYFDFTAPRLLGESEWALRGHWQVAEKSIEAREGATLRLRFGARRVYEVLGSEHGPKRMRVFLDGKPISAADAGSDVHDGAVTVGPQRLYNLVELPRVEHHVIELRPEAGIMGYAFTFG